MNVNYSKHTTSGHGQAHLTSPATPRGYYMCWYTRDLLLQWRRELAPGEAAAMDPQDAGHAPTHGRGWYYYKVSFVDMRGQQAGMVPGGRFGELLGHAERFPGWVIVQADFEQSLAMAMAMGPLPQVLNILCAVMGALGIGNRALWCPFSAFCQRGPDRCDKLEYYHSVMVGPTRIRNITSVMLVAWAFALDWTNPMAQLHVAFYDMRVHYVSD